MDIEKIWPEWKTEKEIGFGSYGKVYKCSREVFGRKEYSAIKVISVPQDDMELAGLATEGMTLEQTKEYYKDIVDSFMNEIKILESLTDEKNIVNIYEYAVVEKRRTVGWQIFIRMELLTNFADYACDKTLTEKDVIKIGRDLCSALEVCGSKRIIHRDIKPENVFVDEEGNFKLGDFGVAKQFEKTLSSVATSIKGTYNYMAPEVFEAKKYDSRADIYSLGLMMYRLLNNNHAPFVDKNKQLVRYNERQQAFERRMAGEKIPPIEGVSDELNEAILKACAFRPEDRFATVTDFKKALTFRTRPTAQKKPENEKKSVLNWIKSNKLKSAAAVLVIVSILISVIALGVKKNDTPERSAVTPGADDVMPSFEGKNVGDTVLFGTYPQSEIKDIKLRTKLESVEKNWVSYGYCCMSESGTVEPSDFMKYADIELDGERYRAVSFTSYKPNQTVRRLSTTQKDINEDESFQKNNGYSVFGHTYYFKYEPVEWTVLDTENKLVVSSMVLDAQAFSNYSEKKGNEYYNSNKHLNYASNYETSSLRTWLNGSFYNTAFSDAEKSHIFTVSIENNAFLTNSIYSGKSTLDSVFVLSVNELTHTDYGFSSDYRNPDEKRTVKSTAYALCQGVSRNSESGNSWCWTRTAGKDSSNSACTVLSSGIISYDSEVDLCCGGIRPAMYLTDEQ